MGVKRVPLPARSPNLNAYAERWVRSVKDEVLSRLILLGNAPCGMRSTSMSPIIMQNVPIRGRATSCSFLLSVKTMSVQA